MAAKMRKKKLADKQKKPSAKRRRDKRLFKRRLRK